jgi:hypothetical protein
MLGLRYHACHRGTSAQRLQPGMAVQPPLIHACATARVGLPAFAEPDCTRLAAKPAPNRSRSFMKPIFSVHPARLMSANVWQPILSSTHPCQKGLLVRKSRVLKRMAADAFRATRWAWTGIFPRLSLKRCDDPPSAIVKSAKILRKNWWVAAPPCHWPAARVYAGHRACGNNGAERNCAGQASARRAQTSESDDSIPIPIHAASPVCHNDHASEGASLFRPTPLALPKALQGWRSEQ